MPKNFDQGFLLHLLLKMSLSLNHPYKKLAAVFNTYFYSFSSVSVSTQYTLVAVYIS